MSSVFSSQEIQSRVIVSSVLWFYRTNIKNFSVLQRIIRYNDVKSILKVFLGGQNLKKTLHHEKIINQPKFTQIS